MIPLTAISLLFLSAHHVLAQDSSNDTDTSYITSVCSPSDQPDAPCIAIQNIETACLPNGTSPLALSAHAQCLCHGSYFAEWLGCRNCLLVHGALSSRNYTYFSSVLSLASQDLCTGTPTAEFATLFTQAQASVPEPTTGGTELSDVSSGDAAVSLYYTASGPQGPGVITGSATEATRVASASSTAMSGSAETGGSTSAGATASTATSTSSSSSAAATGAVGGAKGVLIAAAMGGALVAAL